MLDPFAERRAKPRPRGVRPPPCGSSPEMDDEVAAATIAGSATPELTLKVVRVADDEIEPAAGQLVEEGQSRHVRKRFRRVGIRMRGNAGERRTAPALQYAVETLEMALVLPDDLVRASGLSESELRVELAVALFKDDRLTFGQAARLACVPQADFLDVLGRREIALHYDGADFEEDLATIRTLPSRAASTTSPHRG